MQVGDRMGGKKVGTRFSVLFRDNDPRHIQAVDILNNLGFHGKAQYIVNAVLHYTNHLKEPEAPNTVRLDETSIEAIVSRLFRAGVVTVANQSTNNSEDQEETTLLSCDEIDFDDALEAIGGDGFDAIADALDMFRNK